MSRKKHISILLLFIFIFSNVGWSVNIHYCKGQLKQTSLVLSHDNDVCDLEKTMSCCQDKTDDSHEDSTDEDCCKNEIVKPHTTDQSTQKSLSLNFDILNTDWEWNNCFLNFNYTTKLNIGFLDSYVKANPIPLFKLYCRYLLYA